MAKTFWQTVWHGVWRKLFGMEAFWHTTVWQGMFLATAPCGMEAFWHNKDYD
jgi:hypothetical protein